MRQKFFTNTIQSTFIKNLLLNTSLPIYNSCRNGDYLINGFIYLYDTYLIKCVKSGFLKVEGQQEAEVEIIRDNFILGKGYFGNTKTFESSSNFYDNETHKYLGEYLRFYRDIFKTDLMPFYNCFNGVYTSKFYIDSEKNIVKQSTYDYYQQGTEAFNNRYHSKENFKVIEIPIKFNKEYTIAIDCNSEVLIAPCFVNYNQLMQVRYGGVNLNITTELNNEYNSIFKYTNLMFNTPIKIKITNNSQKTLSVVNKEIIGNVTNMTLEQLFQRYENYLHLLIQLPSTNESSIVVLEGDYTNLPRLYTTTSYDRNGKKVSTWDISKNIFSIDGVEDLDDYILDQLCISDLSLLSLNDNIRYPYSDRLIEYLLWNVVDNNEDIGNNVLEIQQKTGINSNKHPSGYYDKYIRAFIYDLYRKSNKYTNLDNNGYIDKDVEAFLFK